MARPIILPLLALMAGITCSSLLAIPDPPVQACLAFVLLILLAWMKRERRILYPCLLLSFFLAGILAMNRDLHPYRGGDHIIHYVGPDKINVEGVICDNPEVMHDRTATVLSVSRVLREGVYAPASGRLLVSMRGPGVLRYGDEVRIKTRLRLPQSFRNPGGFDYERHLRFRGILVRGFVNDPTGLVVLRRDRGNPLRAALEDFRSLLRQSILETAPATEGSIIRAMILGEQKGIPKETMDLFNRTGTTHIIAISGFNIGIVAVFTLFVVRLFLKSSEYLLLRWNLNVIATVCAIVVVVLYTFIAGLGISVVRASIMVVLFMVAILINRERDLYNTLALAAFLILIVSPSSLFDISFQLSFSAVAALLFFMPRLTALLPPPPPPEAPGLPEGEGLRRRYTIKALRGLALFCFTCASATLGTLPLVVFYFNRLSVVTLAANLLVVPVLGIIAIPFCLLIVLAVPISAALADLIIRVSASLVRVSLVMTEQLAAPSWSSVYVATPSLAVIAAFYLLLISVGFLLDARRNRKEGLPPPKTALFWKAVALFTVLFFIADATLSHQRALHRGTLTLTAVDVGQGSATLMSFA